jgi:hypothetical protein
MKVNIEDPNPALQSIISDPTQIITLDTNFLIPPFRPVLDNKWIKFEVFKKIWLDPIFMTFKNLAIHEAVYEELVEESVKHYVDSKISEQPPQIIIHKDSTLSDIEKGLRQSIENKIAPFTKYEPGLNNKQDRGEVKSLAFIAVRGFLYFAAHDNTAIQLIEKAESWATGLDQVQAIKMYELIYYLYKCNVVDKKALKMLYKYQYFLTKNEHITNPEWGVFIQSMEKLYNKTKLIEL